MKKLPLAIAMVSLFAASTGFATQYYNQDFKVSLDIPSSIDVSGFQQDIINLSMEDLNNSDGVLIGSMEIQTNSSSCTASITTDNNFNLLGPSGKLPYVLDHMAKSHGSSNAYYSYSTKINTQFSSKNTKSQSVGCDTADIKLRLSGASSNDLDNSTGDIKAGAYNDIIHIEVRAS
jgi:hypothetical protein